jgi:bacterioferritin-associated ferredoxin
MFFEMKHLIEENSLNSIEELQKIKPCGQSCKFCIPYINEVFKTGETSFDVIK